MASSTGKPETIDVKAALEAFAGHPLDANEQALEEQIRILPIPFSTYAFTPATAADGSGNFGHLVSKRLVVVFAPTVCSQTELLDVSAVSGIPDTGNATLLLKNFLCPDEAARFYAEPVNIVATAVSPKPVFLTVTHSLVIAPSDIYATNVQINIFAWLPNGTPATDVTVNWRCRVPTSPILF